MILLSGSLGLPFASTWHIFHSPVLGTFSLSVIVLARLCVFGTAMSITTAWRVLRLQIEERPPIRRLAANKLNKQSRTAVEGWSSSLGVGRGANNPSLLKLMFRNTHRRDDSSGDKTIRR